VFRLKVFDVRTGRPSLLEGTVYWICDWRLTTVDAHHGMVYDLCWHDGDDTIATASGDATARLWFMQTGKSLPLHHPAYVYAVRFHPRAPVCNKINIHVCTNMLI